ncbi:MAG: radical SAM protein [Deltaproteobacteria bacterium]|nr:radical SAM protein [Deltaproteobacteria bacterium]
MIPSKTLSLITTFGCNANCAHCSVFSGPKRTDEMPAELIRSLIDQAAADPEIDMVAYTGGEPTLAFDALVDHMAYAWDKGLLAGLVSNSGWAASPEVARSRFDQMTARGLSIYITSVDEYHLEFVDLTHIQTAIRAALDFGVEVHVNLLWTPGFEAQIRDLPATLALPAHVIDAKGAEGLYVWINRPSRMRRVKGDIPQGPLPVIDERVALPCDHINRHPIVAANGNVHMCCGVADSSPQGPAMFSVVGNANEASLDDLLARGRGNLFFNMLAKLGPYRVYQMVREMTPLSLQDDDFCNACEVCARMQKPDMKPHLLRLLEGLTSQVG